MLSSLAGSLAVIVRLTMMGDRSREFQAALSHMKAESRRNERVLSLPKKNAEHERMNEVSEMADAN